jgi:hypothetical protein
MNRLVGFATAVLVALLLLVPVATAADPISFTGRVLFSSDGDLTLPAGERADFVMVSNGTATIAGDARTVVVINGAAILNGAHVENVLGVRSRVTLGAGTVVTGDVRSFEGTVNRAADARVNGTISGFGVDLVKFWAGFAAAMALLYISLAAAAIVAALALAAVAVRQVRVAESLIHHEPVQVFLAGLAAIIGIPLVAVVAIVTVVGIPLGLGILLIVLPLLLFAGYLVAAIAIGNWILRQTTPGVSRARPYLAAVVGVIALSIVSVVPGVGGIASLFGTGAIALMMWRAWRPGGQATPVSTRATAAAAT